MNFSFSFAFILQKNNGLTSQYRDVNVETEGETNNIQRSTPASPLSSFSSLMERISPEKKVSTTPKPVSKLIDLDYKLNFYLTSHNRGVTFIKWHANFAGTKTKRKLYSKRISSLGARTKANWQTSGHFRKVFKKNYGIWWVGILL